MTIECPKCQHENPDGTVFCGKCGTKFDSEIGPTKTIETPKEELTTGSTFAGRYQIIEELGKGGMGRVYKVLDKETNEKIALKLIKPEIASDNKTIDRFRNELTTARQIGHRNVCRMYDLNREKDNYYITMEFVPGEDLKSLIRRVKVDIGTSIKIVKQVCEGLSEAHRLGIIHRDLKPSNIMIDKEGDAKIMDFGIARTVRGKGLTGSGMMIGTPDYMSPEQAEGKDVDQRSDIYSLGIILYEMVTGKLPFSGDTPLSVAMKHKAEIPRAPTEFNPQLPDDLNQLILKCLEKDKERRFQTAGDVLSDLERIEKFEFTTEKRPKPTKRPSTIPPPTFLRKKTLMISATTIMIVAIVVFSIILFFSKRHLQPPQLINPIAITTFLGVEDYPSFSPEAGRLAYESVQSGNWDIWISDIKSGQSVNLTEDYEGADRCPSWSPDGSQIAFLSERNGGGCFTMSHLGGNVRKISPLGSMAFSYGSQPVWSGDSSQLAVFDSDDTKYRMFLRIIDLENRNVENFSLPGPNLMGVEPTWSPDGRFIFYIDTLHPDTDVSQIWAIRISDGKGFPLTDADFKYNNPMCPRDEKHLYFLSNRGGGSDLWRLEVNTEGLPVSEPKSISTGLELKHFSFSSDGSKFAYASGREISTVWRIPILENRLATWDGAERLTDDQIYVGQVEVTPDKKRLLLDRRLRNVRALWMMDLESKDMTQITSGKPRETVVGRMSLDGKKVVYHIPELTCVNIWALNLEDRKPWKVTDEEGWNSNPCWSPDGKSIAFVSNRSGNWDIYTVSEKGGQERQLTKNPAPDSTPLWSPDGKWILFYSGRTGSGQVWKIPAEGGNPVPVTEPGVSGVITWSVNGKDIYFNKDSKIWRVSAEGGNEHPIIDLRHKRGGVEFPLSTDGKYIYFSWREGSGDIWVMDVINEKNNKR